MPRLEELFVRRVVNTEDSPPDRSLAASDACLTDHRMDVAVVLCETNKLTVF